MPTELLTYDAAQIQLAGVDFLYQAIWGFRGRGDQGNQRERLVTSFVLLGRR